MSENETSEDVAGGTGRGQEAARRPQPGDHRGRSPVLHPGFADDLRHRLRHQDARAARAGGAVPGPAHARLADPDRARGDIHAVHPGRAPGAAAQPGQRLHRRGPGRLGRPRDQARRHRALPVRAEDRRAGDRPRLPGRRAGQGGHPGRRAHRRGRHAEHPHHLLHPGPAQGHRAPGHPRGQGRGVHAGRGVRQAERVAARRGQGRRSPTRATRRPGRCGRRTRGSPRPGRWTPSCTASAGSRAPRR